MRMIHEALSPEKLEKFKKLMEAESEMTSEAQAEALDEKLRREADEAAEHDDRNRHERRKAAALERRGC